MPQSSVSEDGATLLYVERMTTHFVSFATTVLAAFFPIFLSDYWAPEGVDSTTYLAYSTSVTNALVAVMSPIMV
ncbi:hypothetical protein KIPB_001662 [Kipferlia bialata]|uniref:MFS transporter n=1 Tax=Kipferlia bialata TaxID=797122 RepID=A0A9K3GFB4_9EUKA|nr:hypothetical protein KIPB_001662 [Kipferlia bialata]|eukprot:g1662.t1